VDEIEKNVMGDAYMKFTFIFMFDVNRGKLWCKRSDLHDRAKA